MTLIVEDLIGKPFEYGGRGPEKYDCWGLMMELYRRIGVEIPDYRSPTTWAEIASLMNQELRLWEEVPRRTLHSVMHIRIKSEPHHVGLFLGGDRFIHASNGARSVCIEPASRWENATVGYYKYVG